MHKSIFKESKYFKDFFSSVHASQYFNYALLFVISPLIENSYALHAKGFSLFFSLSLPPYLKLNYKHLVSIPKAITHSHEIWIHKSRTRTE